MFLTISGRSWQILSRLLADLGRCSVFFLRGRRPGFTIFGSKIYAKIMKIHEKWSQEATKKAWEIIKNEVLKTSWFWGAFLEARGLRFSWLLASLGRFWDDFGDPLKSEGGVQNDPKKSIRRLGGVLNEPRGRKKLFLEALRKCIVFWMDFSRFSAPF